MTMTAKLVVQEGLRAVRARGLPRAGAVPVPRRLERRGAAGARAAVQARRSTRRRSPASVLEPVQGEGGFIPMPDDFPAGCRSSARARDPLRRRRGAGGRRPYRAGLGDRALRRRAGPVVVGQVARRRAAARRRDRPRRGDGRGRARRARRHVRRQPAVVRRRARRAGRGRRRPRSARGAEELGERLRARARRDRRAQSGRSARCAASARCSRSSW